ncbi:hypothetical protein [Mycobacterium barrassiae]|uniref:hypothetical protein n=1 Tax=Mycobacterium barrassiae TaxID=319709 RepID=UPI0022659587|nr:hypothetical protein [Mycobacterium barrassiae]
MATRPHNKPRHVDVDGPSRRLPDSVARMNDDASRVGPRHHGLGQLAVGRDVDCQPLALYPLPHRIESQ